MKSASDVSAFMSTLNHPLKAGIESVRQLVLSADPRLREQIKWNAPSFALADDLITFSLRSQAALEIIMHTGAKKRATPLDITVADPAGLLRRLAPDRGIITLSSLEDIESKSAALVDLVRQWIAQVEDATQAA
jgi:hypothetical protein